MSHARSRARVLEAGRTHDKSVSAALQALMREEPDPQLLNDPNQSFHGVDKAFQWLITERGRCRFVPTISAPQSPLQISLSPLLFLIYTTNDLNSLIYIIDLAERNTYPRASLDRAPRAASGCRRKAFRQALGGVCELMPER